MTKFCPKLAFLVILGQAVPTPMVPCWWFGWWLWRAGCISQETYLLLSIILILINKSPFHISSMFVHHLHNLLPTVFHLVFNGICFEPQTFLIKALHNVLNIIKHPIRKKHNILNIAKGTTDPGVDCFDQ